MSIIQLLSLFLLIIPVYSFNFEKPNLKNNWLYKGDTKPLNYFDPFGLTSNTDEKIIKLVREGGVTTQQNCNASISDIGFFGDYNK